MNSEQKAVVVLVVTNLLLVGVLFSWGVSAKFASFSTWLSKWQTLLSGAIAAFAAFATIYQMRKTHREAMTAKEKQYNHEKHKRVVSALTKHHEIVSGLIGKPHVILGLLRFLEDGSDGEKFLNRSLKVSKEEEGLFVFLIENHPMTTASHNNINFLSRLLLLLKSIERCSNRIHNKNTILPYKRENYVPDLCGHFLILYCLLEEFRNFYFDHENYKLDLDFALNTHKEEAHSVIEMFDLKDVISEQHLRMAESNLRKFSRTIRQATPL